MFRSLSWIRVSLINFWIDFYFTGDYTSFVGDSLMEDDFLLKLLEWREEAFLDTHDELLFSS